MQRSLFKDEVFEVVDRLVREVGVGGEIRVSDFDRMLVEGGLIHALDAGQIGSPERAWRVRERKNARDRINKMAKQAIEPFQVTVRSVGREYVLEPIGTNAALFPERRHKSITDKIMLGEREVHQFLDRSDLHEEVRLLLEDYKNDLDMLAEVAEGINRHRAKKANKFRQAMAELEKDGKVVPLNRGQAAS